MSERFGTRSSKWKRFPAKFSSHPYRIPVDVSDWPKKFWALSKRHSGVAPGWYGQGLWPASLRATDAPGQCTRKMSKHQSADSPVRAFLASDQVRAEQAVRAPVSPFLERILCLTLLAQRSVALRGTAGLRFAMGSYLRSWT